MLLAGRITQSQDILETCKNHLALSIMLSQTSPVENVAFDVNRLEESKLLQIQCARDYIQSRGNQFKLTVPTPPHLPPLLRQTQA
jgi:hypothetical protein